MTEGAPRRRLCKYTILVLLFALGVLYLWKEMDLKSASERREEEHARLLSLSDARLARHTKEMIRLSGVSLAWVVREELLRNNHQGIDRYLTQFVKERGVREILVANVAGTIIAATNKKIEGASFEEVFPGDLMTRDDIHVEDLPDGIVRMIVPIMAPTARLGVLLLLFAPDTSSS
jgi:hypothetical protein